MFEARYSIRSLTFHTEGGDSESYRAYLEMHICKTNTNRNGWKYQIDFNSASRCLGDLSEGSVWQRCWTGEEQLVSEIAWAGPMRRTEARSVKL